MKRGGRRSGSPKELMALLSRFKLTVRGSPGHTFAATRQEKFRMVCTVCGKLPLCGKSHFSGSMGSTMFVIMTYRTNRNEILCGVLSAPNMMFLVMKF